MKKKNTKTRLKKLQKTFHHHVKLTFVPHRANHYRPHLVRRYGLLVVLAMVVSGQGLYNLSASGAVLGETSTITNEALLAGTNAERAKQQLVPLKMNKALSHAANLKANDMFQHDYWAHVSPSGVTPWQWMAQAGYKYDYAGENLAKDFRAPESVMSAWMASPEHEANVLGVNYTEVGFATIEGTLGGETTTLVVALYGNENSDVMTPIVTSAPIDQPLAPITRLGVAVQSMTPAALGSILLLIVVALVALAAHMYRNKLPKNLRLSWYRHHGLIKVSGMLSLCIVVLLLYSGGQI